ncbi:MAG: hypothetical protein OJF51_000167 [Nitrospira sp.]|nr:MAG: hypothetical protein OJF51_000167 [Nitrospira sp.]
MGPRHLCHGISALVVPSPIAFSSFNGATASLPWNQRQDITRPMPIAWLQWGHGISAMESEQVGAA